MTTTNGNISWISEYIWESPTTRFADLYVRGKYRDVILPMTVLRRLDSVLEKTKQSVLEMKASLDAAGVVAQDQALRQVAGQAFYNTSPFTLRDLRARANRSQLKADFEAYLDGFSPNVQDIPRQLRVPEPDPAAVEGRCVGYTHREADVARNQSESNRVMDTDGSVRYASLDNHGMGTIFEELVRRFNEENNEEAGSTGRLATP